MRTRWIIALVFVATSATAGCSDDSASGGGPSNAIYKITAATDNANACDAPGESVLEDFDQGYFYVRSFSFFGTQMVNVVSCGGVEECNTLTNQEDGGTAIDWSFVLDSPGMGSGGGGETCEGEATETTSAEVEGGVEILTQVYEVHGVPKDSDGFCDDAAVERALTADSCVRRSTIVGAYEAPLETTNDGTIHL